MVRLLLEAGADLNEGGGIVYMDFDRDVIVCTDGTALELARKQGHIGVVNLLEEALRKLRVQNDISSDEREEGLPKEKNMLSPERKRVRVLYNS